MFKFLKEKLKGALGKFSKDVDKEVEKEVVQSDVSREDLEKTKEKKGFFQNIFGKKEDKKAEKPIIKEQAPPEQPKPLSPTPKPEPKSEPTIVEKKVEIHKPDVKVEKPPVISEPIAEKTPIVHQKNVIKPKQEEIITQKPQDTVKREHSTIPKSDIIERKKEEPKTDTVKREHSAIPKSDIIERKKEEPKTDKIASEVKPIEPEGEQKKGFFTRIAETFTKFNLSEEKFEELFWELEVVLLENNVAVEVIDKIKADMKKELMSGKILRRGVEELVLETLKKSIIELFDIDKIDLMKKIREKKQKPFVIAIIGVNGSGKTTSIAKLTHMFQKTGLKVVLAASDTFRAAAIQQLEEHANRLNTKLIKHDYHSDPAAVAFDAIKYAEAKSMDVVLIDTAGRLHSNTNLMKELEKVIRVCKPDIKIFVGESITGNDCVEQAKQFDKAAGIDAIILAKADIDEKGGAAISVSYVTKKPILYLGTGQTYDDLKAFDSRMIIESLEL